MIQSPRRRYIDWLRGVAVLIMIEGHTLDSWTHPADRSEPLFGKAILLAGLGAPLFLMLAGVAVSLSAGAKARRADEDRAATAVLRRGWQIFGLAFLFRLQTYVLGGGGQLLSLLKVDILNVMGISLVTAAAIWRLARAAKWRIFAFAAVTMTIAMSTPLVRATPFLAFLPDPIEAYLRPVPRLTNFTLFPAAGFVFAGAAVGVLLDRALDAATERRLQIRLALAGAAAALGGYGASFLPAIYAHSSFWTSSPTFFFVRLGILLIAIPLAYAWGLRPTGHHWSPLQQFGRTSLFIYWIHVEMVYGVFSGSIHKRLALNATIVAFAAFTLFLFSLSLLKDRAARAWRARQGIDVQKVRTGSA